jgi:hypothetical protein
MTHSGIIHYPGTNGFNIVQTNKEMPAQEEHILLEKTLKALIYKEQYKPGLCGQGAKLAKSNSALAYYKQMQIERGWLIIDKVIIYIKEQNKINVYQILYIQMMNLKFVLRFHKVFFLNDLNIKALKNILSLRIGSSKKMLPAAWEHFINSIKKIFNQQLKPGFVTRPIINK